MEEYAVQLRIVISSQRIEPNQSLYMVTATIMHTKRSIKRITWKSRPPNDYENIAREKNPRSATTNYPGTTFCPLSVSSTNL